jgi:radical SAM-linked protein
VGTESQAEYLDLELHGTPAAYEVADRVRRELPEGFRLLSCEPVDGDGASLSRTIRAIEYRVELPDGAPDPGERLAEFASRAEAVVLREREGKTPVRIDLKSALQALCAGGPREVRFTLRAGETQATARPSELLGALFGPEWVKPGLARIVRENVVFGAPAPPLTC